MKSKYVPMNNEITLYEICLTGHLTDRWASRFGDVSITLTESGVTRLTCRVVDQAALFGLLKKVRDVGLPLLSVNPIVQPHNQIQSNRGDLK